MRVCVCAHVCTGGVVYVYECRCLQRPYLLGPPGAGLAGGCELAEMGSGNWTWVLWKAASILNHWAVSPVWNPVSKQQNNNKNKQNQTEEAETATRLSPWMLWHAVGGGTCLGAAVSAKFTSHTNLYWPSLSQHKLPLELLLLKQGLTLKPWLAWSLYVDQAGSACFCPESSKIKGCANTPGPLKQASKNKQKKKTNNKTQSKQTNKNCVSIQCFLSLCSVV